jgi:hypothetical protein
MPSTKSRSPVTQPVDRLLCLDQLCRAPRNLRAGSSVGLPSTRGELCEPTLPFVVGDLDQILWLRSCPLHDWIRVSAYSKSSAPPTKIEANCHWREIFTLIIDIDSRTTQAIVNFKSGDNVRPETLEYSLINFVLLSDSLVGR